MFRCMRPVALVGRQFSAAVSHAPPKKVHGTIGRYAEAVYIAASKASSLDKVEGELLAFGDVLKKNTSFGAFLANPTVPRSDKTSLLGGVLEEGKVSHITRNLFLTLAANGKIGEASQVIAGYTDLMQAKRGVVRAVIISAEPLKKKTLDSVKGAVLSLVGTGKTVDLSVQVDEKILGGLQVMVGDQFLDLSVSARIGTLSTALDTAL